MRNCFDYDEKAQFGFIKHCPNCNAKFCHDCAEKTRDICPFCYSDLEY